LIEEFYGKMIFDIFSVYSWQGAMKIGFVYRNDVNSTSSHIASTLLEGATPIVMLNGFDIY
jgi:hypothetical protein